MTAALESGRININSTADCTSGAITVGGHTIKDASHKSNKIITLPEILGYSSNVGVIKLITKDTIEEQIYELQEKKKALIDKMLQPGESFLSKLSEEEIRNLFM